MEEVTFAYGVDKYFIMWGGGQRPRGGRGKWVQMSWKERTRC